MNIPTLDHYVDGASGWYLFLEKVCPVTGHRRSIALIFRISRNLVMAESKGLVWCTDDNPLRIVCILESTWSMGPFFSPGVHHKKRYALDFHNFSPLRKILNWT